MQAHNLSFQCHFHLQNKHRFEEENQYFFYKIAILENGLVFTKVVKISHFVVVLEPCSVATEQLWPLDLTHLSYQLE